jgi:hypothetical protein
MTFNQNDPPSGLGKVLLQVVHEALGRGQVLVARHALDHVHRHPGPEPQSDRVVPQPVHAPPSEPGAVAHALEGLRQPVLPPRLALLVERDAPILRSALRVLEEPRERGP